MRYAIIVSIFKDCGVLGPMIPVLGLPTPPPKWYPNIVSAPQPPPTPHGRCYIPNHATPESTKHDDREAYPHTKDPKQTQTPNRTKVILGTVCDLGKVFRAQRHGIDVKAWHPQRVTLAGLRADDFGLTKTGAIVFAFVVSLSFINSETVCDT